MASGATTIYDLPYPLQTDQVNVHGDIQSLAEQLELILPTIGVPYHDLEVTNISGTTINKGDPVYITGYSNTALKPTVAKSQASNLNTFPIVGLATAQISNNTDGEIITSGIFVGPDTSTFAAGDVLYVASSGGLTNTAPSSGSSSVGVVVRSAGTGIVIVTAGRGNGTWGALKAGLI